MVHSKLHLLPVEQTQLDLLNHNLSHPCVVRNQTPCSLALWGPGRLGTLRV